MPEFPISIEFGRIHKKIIIDPTVFPPCIGKIESMWSWKKFRDKKYLIHVSKGGKWRIHPFG